MYHIFWAESGVPFVLVRQWLPALGSNVGSRAEKQPSTLISFGTHREVQVRLDTHQWFDHQYMSTYVRYLTSLLRHHPANSREDENDPNHWQQVEGEYCEP